MTSPRAHALHDTWAVSETRRTIDISVLSIARVIGAVILVWLWLHLWQLLMLVVVAVVVAPPAGVLHLKSACSLVDEHTLLATRALAEALTFSGLDIVMVPDGEESAANALCVNGTVLIAEGFPQTRALLANRGYEVRALALEQVAKLDAALSCMSLRW